MDFSFVLDWLGIADLTWVTWLPFVVTLVIIAALMGAVQGACAYSILAERKISAWAQDRIGPNRVGLDLGFNFFPFTLLKHLGGLGQPIADGLKFLLKEQVIPNHVDKLFYLFAPMIAVGTATLAIAVVPFGATTPVPVLLDRRTPEQVSLSQKALTPEQRQQAVEKIVKDKQFAEKDRYDAIWPISETERAIVLAADRAWAQAKGKPSYEAQVQQYNRTLQFVVAPGTDISIVFVFAIGSLAAYAIVLAGWSSNNKYSFMGALRSSAQLISYEIPMGMSVLGVFLLTGTLNAERIIQHQLENGWFFFTQPLATLLFAICIFAECNRVPFDLPECEQELVGGYHTEYSGMKFALFFLGEYTHMITTSFLMMALFFGGWHLPFITSPSAGGVVDAILKLLIFGGKMVLFIIFYMYIRWTLPRFRFDQLMGLAWKVMLPLAFVNLIAVMYVNHFPILGSYTQWLLLPISLITLVVAGACSLQADKEPTRAKIVVHGHPVTGRRVLVN